MKLFTEGASERSARRSPQPGAGAFGAESATESRGYVTEYQGLYATKYQVTFETLYRASVIAE